ncbi:LPS export ABC transporter periplasmic protein LptC [Pontibacter actiniarum]|uniref:LPS export ABC transporter periplasmic protein LptC n=2 Tax=Pontibacter actiniarum TaxID=323450 RepID=A0A1X9YVZ2_9BACT|nr:LPS export ABC transporter periplasmic protein LptC [Pontibacter actiniarum]
MRMRNGWIAGLTLVLTAVFSLGCERDIKNPDEEERYTGPTIENHDVTTLYSDSARLMIKLQAPVQQEFEGGEGVFPKGFYVEFYDDNGKLESTLRGNYGKQEPNKNMYTARGNVVVNNLKKQEKLETEELFWDRSKAKIFTDKFVRITTPEEVLTGTGLTANQDMSRYSIKKVTGKFNFNEQ